MLRFLTAPISLICLTALAAPGLSQTPTSAQQQAIRSACVADYRANCSSTPTGGMAALVCLEQHESKLSPQCQSAVEAVDTKSSSSASASTSSSATETKPAATTTSKSETASAGTSTKSDEMTSKPAAASGAPKMSFRDELRLAAGDCARDFRLLCPNIPVGHGNALFCLKVHGPKLDPTCRGALQKAGEVF